MEIVGGQRDAAHADAALAAFGLQPDPDDADHALLIWPENMQAVQIFEFLQTQWCVAPAGGVVGLRYDVIPLALEVNHVAHDMRAEVTRGVQVMEAAAMEHINRSQ